MKRKLKSVITMMVCVCMVLSMSMSSNAATWRKTKSVKVNGYNLTARANLPYFSDRNGGGAWKTQAEYRGKKDGNKITTAWSFYSVGGSVSWNGLGLIGSGTSTGGQYSAKGNQATANGYVYGTGFALYVGMISTASFSKGNSFYSTSCKI